MLEKLPTFAPHMEAVELTNALWACAKLEVAAVGVFEQLIPALIKQCADRLLRSICCVALGSKHVCTFAGLLHAR